VNNRARHGGGRRHGVTGTTKHRAIGGSARSVRRRRGGGVTGTVQGANTATGGHPLEVQIMSRKPPIHARVDFERQEVFVFFEFSVLVRVCSILRVHEPSRWMTFFCKNCNDSLRLALETDDKCTTPRVARVSRLLGKRRVSFGTRIDAGRGRRKREEWEFATRGFVDAKARGER
jgi:hypothetical protein